MLDKDLNELPGKETLALPPRPYVEIPTFGKFFKKNGGYDGKLFHSNDKITYTFVLDREEIISLHFDKTRQALFYKGHNVSNMQLTQVQIFHFEQFGRELRKDPATQDFVEAFIKTLEQYLITHPLVK